ncbi:MAG TPA: hypothetical protein VJB14_06825, partial [Planctomycetota bacterium]|nr:hypothetical protein [Planctomycetota bacterium]
TAKLGLRAMSSAGRQDDVLRAILNTAAGVSSAAPAYSLEFVQALGREALAEGDPARGEKVFRGTLTNCFSCHAIGGAGGKVGPDVSAVGTGLPIDMMIESVLWPNRQVKEGYGSTAVITKSDQILTGFRVNEDKQTLILRDPNLEGVLRIPIADIKARKEIGSVMPEGLANGLTRAELRDLIRFLCDLGKPGPFRVPDRPYVRRWEAAGSWGTWAPRYSTVAGELPLDEPGGPLTLRLQVEVLQAGRFAFRVDSTAGLTREGAAWREGLEIELGRGRHAIAFTVDPAKRGRTGLRCEVLPAPGSKGELRLVQ